ncbi:MAG: DUF6807 family protein [Pirellulaceae bacterium]
MPGRAEISDRLPHKIQVEQQADRLVFTSDAGPMATYVFGDREIQRPYFAHVHVPGGRQITRHHPPRTGIDATDHATMHPGIWLAFGDIGGGDFWRNKGRVEHALFVERATAKAEGKDGVARFAVRNRYVAGDKTICEEIARHTVHATRNGYLIAFDSTFSGNEPFAFGDQEEMGLGIRLATPVAVKGGTGTIANSAGDRNENEVWGRPADWCDYSGVVTQNSGRKVRIGLLLVPHSGNFRRSWMHARDYGLLVANPFGQQAFTKMGPASSLEVKPGESLRLRFGVWSYAARLDQKTDLAALAAEYHRLAGE